MEFDFVVVGGGTAGCVLAARLTETGTYSVALLEAGGEADNFWIKMPLGYGKLYDDPRYNWLYEGEPEPGLNGSKSFQPRGKVLGGTGSINGSIYQRGQREDFDYWRQLGNIGWSYDDVLPYFKKAEDNALGPDDFYGVGGPMTVGRAGLTRDELGEAFINAAVQAGFTKNEHGFNGRSQEGFAYNQASIRNGRRCSTALAYLQPARGRKNLHVITGALVSRVILTGTKATAIQLRRAGVTRTISARREVILAGGAYNSPQLLQVSGIGPGKVLESLGIPLLVDLPGVGKNLQNHISVGIKYRCSRPITINDVVHNPIRRVVAGLQYIFLRSGVLTTTALNAAGMIRTDPARVAPDIKVQLQNWIRTHTGRSKERMGLDRLSGFTVTAQLMHPEDRGTVFIKSTDSAAAPSIIFNYTFSEQDQRSIVGGLHAIRKIMAMPAIAPYIVGEISPGPQCASDMDLTKFFRSSAIPANHPTSTCKMGTDPMAVVDSRLHVRGAENLRVIDASIMPRTVAANPNATTIMIAEKGAAMVIEDARAKQE